MYLNVKIQHTRYNKKRDERKTKSLVINFPYFFKIKFSQYNDNKSYKIKR